MLGTLLVLGCLAPARPQISGVRAVREAAYAVPDSVNLAGVIACHLSPGGELFLMASGSPFLLVFDSGGRLVRTVGRAGDGPGEFREPLRFGWVGDTLRVTDFLHRRITLFDARGERTLGTFPWPSLRSQRRSVPARVFAVLAGGFVLAIEETPRLDFRAPSPTALPVLLATRTDGGHTGMA